MVLTIYRQDVQGCIGPGFLLPVISLGLDMWLVHLVWAQNINIAEMTGMESSWVHEAREVTGLGEISFLPPTGYSAGDCYQCWWVVLYVCCALERNHLLVIMCIRDV